MAFICDFCKTPQAQGTKPTFVVEAQEKVYIFPFPEEEERKGFTVKIQEDGELVLTTVGKETVKEYKVCLKCSGVEVKPQIVPDFAIERAKGRLIGEKGSHNHECKKSLDECQWCKKDLEFFRTRPLIALTQITQDVLAPTFKTSLAAVAVGALLERTKHQSKRAERDFQVSYRLLKNYEKRGGGI